MVTAAAPAMEQIILRQLIRRLGPAGRLVRELIEENQRLQQENEALRAAVTVRRPMKARSPASWRFRVRRFELGQMQIYPHDQPQGKIVPSLRVHLPLEDKIEGTPFWDITSKRLIATLLPVLPAIQGTDTYVEVSKQGDGRTSAFTVAIRPPASP
jgi:hypothetical protein